MMVNTHEEGTAHGSLPGLLERGGSVRGLITPGEDIFVAAETGEPADENQRERLYLCEDV